MANTTITDATDILKSSYNVFESSIHDGAIAMYPKIDISLNTAIDELLQIPKHIQSFLVGRRIKYSLDGSDFRNAYAALQTAVQSELSNRFNIVSSDYQSLKSSINTDFNNVIGDAQNAFVSAIQSYYITDSDFNTKFSDTQAKMKQAVTDATPLITDRISGNDAQFTSAQSQVSQQVAQLVRDFVFGYPVVRNAGNTRVPSSPVFDGVTTNDFSIDLQNISKVPWNGYLGIEFTDEYKKHFVNNEAAGVISTIPPGETHTVTRSIAFPAKVSVVPTKGKNIGKPTMVPWGKTLTYKINIRTRLS
jgi:hypothetical protein